MEAMKNKNLPRSIFFLAAFLSVASYLYVNTNSVIPMAQAGQTAEYIQEQIQEEEKSGKDFPMPDIALLSKLVEIAGKIIPGGH